MTIKRKVFSEHGCEYHDEFGVCTQECADFSNSMCSNPSDFVDYDPTGCSYHPQTWTEARFDPETKSVILMSVTDDGLVGDDDDE